MKKRYEKLIQLWQSEGYNGMLRLPIKTDYMIKGRGDRHIITHRGVSFVWINGNKENYPLIIVPLKRYSIHVTNYDFDYSAYKIVLEYISLLNLIVVNINIDILHRSIRNYFSHNFDDIETLKPFYYRTTLSYYDKLEFRMNNDLSNTESVILSLFREGNSIENIFYSYLSFFRIFEFLFKKEVIGSDGKKHNNWNEFNNRININLYKIRKKCVLMNPAMGDYDNFMSYYKKSNKNIIGEYLSGNRDTIAHGILGTKKVNTPNNFDNYLEIQYARSFIRAAAYLVVQEKIDTDIIIKYK